MTVLDILYTTLIMPLQLFFEVLYMLTNSVIDNPGMSIIALSLMMNFLILPLYMRADAMQEAERDMENKLRDGIAHIKATFKGDERMMMLQAYYRQNDYRPTDVFKGSISLFLEIPFFISAYMFLSHLQIVQGVPFGIISDLGAPDGLLVIGDLHINVLPFVMTGINLISCILFTKGMPTKTKVQLYGMALFFLVFLYASPAGLVFYWTLNNVFALVKTIFYKLKNPKKVLVVMFAVIGVVVLGCTAAFAGSLTSRQLKAALGLGVVCLVPVAFRLMGKKVKFGSFLDQFTPNKLTFISCALFLTFLIGGYISTTIVSASPLEFIDKMNYVNPMWAVISTLCLSAGMFLVWFGVFYWLCNDRAKVVFEFGLLAVCICAIVTYQFFGTSLGNLTPALQYENGLDFSGQEMLLNAAAIVGVIVLVAVLFKFTNKLLPRLMMVLAIALAGLSVYNVTTINSAVEEALPSIEAAQAQKPQFNLSKDGNNVVVIMMDRAIGEYLPYFINEKPELKEMFAGFTYYPNTVSFGGFTNVGSPAFFGGYEYTPTEMDKRSNELLKDKHNEALKMMPVLFGENGYDVTVFDPTYANYTWIPDVSIYDEYPYVDAYVTKGFFDKAPKAFVENNKRNLFCFGVTKCMPLRLQPIFYSDGTYNSSKSNLEEAGVQVASDDNMTAEGFNEGALESIAVLNHMPSMTNVVEGDSNNFLMMVNDLTHDPMLMQEPQYEPANQVDNTQYEALHSDRYTLDGRTLTMADNRQYIHYQSNMAAMLKLGAWLDYLKQQGVYENTRIVISADHGRAVQHNADMQIDGKTDTPYDIEFYYPLLLVKDFGKGDFSTSEDFMTNADVPTLAVTGLFSNPVNPFTGKLINNDEKFAHDQRVFLTYDYQTDVNNGTTWLPGGLWMSVHDDMRKPSNWTILDDQLKL